MKPQDVIAKAVEPHFDKPHHNLMASEIVRALADAGFVIIPAPVGEPMDPRFRPTSRDLVALREDSAAAGREGLPVKVNVAPAVLYMAWPNTKHDPSDEESSPYRCISFNIPKPE